MKNENNLKSSFMNFLSEPTKFIFPTFIISLICLILTISNIVVTNAKRPDRHSNKYKMERNFDNSYAKNSFNKSSKNRQNRPFNFDRDDDFDDRFNRNDFFRQYKNKPNTRDDSNNSKVKPTTPDQDNKTEKQTPFKNFPYFNREENKKNKFNNQQNFDFSKNTETH